MATGIIQANSEAQNKAIKSFIKGQTGGHNSAHQVIGEKIKFVLGGSLNVEAVASAIEKGGIDDGNASAGSSTGETTSTSGWIWSTERNRYYRQRSDGSYEWSEAEKATPNGEWTWSAEKRNYYRYNANGAVEWSK